MNSSDDRPIVLSEDEKSRIAEILLQMTEMSDLKELQPLFWKARAMSIEDKLGLLEYLHKKFQIPGEQIEKLDSICLNVLSPDESMELMRLHCQRRPLPRFLSVNEQMRMSQNDWIDWLDKCYLLVIAHAGSPLSTLQLLIQRDNSEVDFLTTYILRSFALRSDAGKDMTSMGNFRDGAFILIDRILNEVVPVPTPLLTWPFLSIYSSVYKNRVKIHDKKIDNLWVKYSLGDTESFQGGKVELIEVLEELAGNSPSTLPEHGIRTSENVLRGVVSLLRSCYHYGHFLMVGSEVLDALNNAFYKVSEALQGRIATISYLALRSLLDGDKTNISMLLDHLYSLAADGVNRGKSGNKPASLLAKVELDHVLLPKLKRSLDQKQAARAQSLFAYLEPFSKIRRKAARKKNVAAGKRRATAEDDHCALGQVHVNTVRQVLQIQDVFPKLGYGFIVKLLDYYQNNTEVITAHLLDDTLPEHLKFADHSEELYVRFHRDGNARPTDFASDGNAPLNQQNATPDLAPHNTPPLLPERRNVFDNDAFDNLTIDPAKLHQGRKNKNMTADDILADQTNKPNKAAILANLAKFDPDDDERDDTYDAEEVGGTVDSVMPGSDEVNTDLRDGNEEALFRAYKMSPDSFNRDSKTRRSNARTVLKSETAMTDEAIEGWAIMLNRDPGRHRRLEAKYATFTGAQRELASTSYRDNSAGSTTEESDWEARGAGGFRGRGKGRGGRGNVAGPAGEKDTQVARHRKDASKGSRANHNRRDQRAKKMARGGFLGIEG